MNDGIFRSLSLPIPISAFTHVFPPFQWVYLVSNFRRWTISVFYFWGVPRLFELLLAVVELSPISTLSGKQNKIPSFPPSGKTYFHKISEPKVESFALL